MASLLPPYSTKHIILLGSITVLAGSYLLFFSPVSLTPSRQTVVAETSAEKLQGDEDLNSAIVQIQQHKSANAWFDYGVQLIDIRSTQEFEDWHIQGANSVQVEDLKQSTFPSESKIILYSQSEEQLNEAKLVLKEKQVASVMLLSDSKTVLEEQGIELEQGSRVDNDPYIQELIEQARNQ